MSLLIERKYMLYCFETTLTMLVNPTDKARIDFVSEILMEVVQGRLNASILVKMFDKRNALGTG